MQKYQAIITFKMDPDFMNNVPAHRSYINNLIQQQIIDHYVVSLQSRRVWITLTAKDENTVRNLLAQSPLFPYFTSIEVEALMVYDGQLYRLPALQLN